MAKTRPQPDEEPRERSRLFWICVLVLLEALLWTLVATVAGAPDAVALAVALVGGGIFVFVFRDRIWGEDWREELAASRAKRPR